MLSVLYYDQHNKPVLWGLASFPIRVGEVAAAPMWLILYYDQHSIYAHIDHISSPSQEVVALLQGWPPAHFEQHLHLVGELVGLHWPNCFEFHQI